MTALEFATARLAEDMFDNWDKASEKQWMAALTELNDAYRDGEPLVSDADYDDLYDYAKERFPDHSFFHSVGGGTALDDVDLDYYMSSRDKIKQHEKFVSWLSSMRKDYGTDQVCASYKLDGIALQLRYENNKLVRAATQGLTGNTGRDVTHLVRHVKTVPQVLHDRTKLDLDVLVVRCEAIFPKEAQEQVLQLTEKAKHKSENLRAKVNGVFSRKEVDATTKQLLALVEINALQIMGVEHSPSTQFQLLSSLNFMVPEWEVLDGNSLNANELSQFFADAKDSDYMCDGVVLTINATKLETETSGNPDWSIAYKEEVATQVAQVRVLGVEYNTGKHGALNPRIITEPVQLGDVTVESFYGFNGQFIQTGKRKGIEGYDNSGPDKPIGAGTILEVYRSGDVIPYIKSVVIGAAEPALPDVEFEQRGTEFYPVSKSGNFADERLGKSRERHAIAGTVQRIIHLLKVLGVKGAGDVIVAQAMEALTGEQAGDVADEYGIEESAVTAYHAMLYLLTGPEGWEYGNLSPKRALALYNSLNDALAETTLAELLFASSIIPTIGEVKANEIDAKLPWLADLRKPVDQQELYEAALEIPDFGPVAATNLSENWPLFAEFAQCLGFNELAVRAQMAKRTANAMLSEEGLVAARSGKFTGGFYLTGMRDKALTEALIALGYTKLESFNANKCNLLIAAEENSATQKKVDAMNKVGKGEFFWLCSQYMHAHANLFSHKVFDSLQARDE